jgi:hypothetical protein
LPGNFYWCDEQILWPDRLSAVVLMLLAGVGIGMAIGTLVLR